MPTECSWTSPKLWIGCSATLLVGAVSGWWAFYTWSEDRDAHLVGALSGASDAIIVELDNDRQQE